MEACGSVQGWTDSDLSDWIHYSQSGLGCPGKQCGYDSARRRLGGVTAGADAAAPARRTAQLLSCSGGTQLAAAAATTTTTTMWG